MSHSDDEGKDSVLHATALYLFAGLVYIVFFVIHIVQKRTLEGKRINRLSAVMMWASAVYLAYIIYNFE